VRIIVRKRLKIVTVYSILNNKAILSDWRIIL
jgi:hypothetical protein